MNEHKLRNDIVLTWGENSAHVEFYDSIVLKAAQGAALASVLKKGHLALVEAANNPLLQLALEVVVEQRNLRAEIKEMKEEAQHHAWEMDLLDYD